MRFAILVVMILFSNLILVADQPNDSEILKTSVNPISHYYDLMKKNRKPIESFKSTEIINLDTSTILGISQSDTIEDIVKKFGGVSYEKVFEDGNLWSKKTVCNMNLSLLIQADKLVGIEIKLPSPYLFLSKSGIDGYETIDDLFQKLGNPTMSLNDDYTTFTWFINNHVVDFMTYKNNPYPSYFRYYF